MLPPCSSILRNLDLPVRGSAQLSARFHTDPAFVPPEAKGDVLHKPGAAEGALLPLPHCQFLRRTLPLRFLLLGLQPLAFIVFRKHTLSSCSLLRQQVSGRQGPTPLCLPLYLRPLLLLGQLVAAYP